MTKAKIVLGLKDAAGTLAQVRDNFFEEAESGVGKDLVRALAEVDTAIGYLETVKN